MMDDTYPTIRDLDGVYFRIKRGENWIAICFTDMTEAERKEVMEGRSAEWLGSLALCLADRLREIADELDIVKRLYLNDDGAEIGFAWRSRTNWMAKPASMTASNANAAKSTTFPQGTATAAED